MLQISQVIQKLLVQGGKEHKEGKNECNMWPTKSQLESFGLKKNYTSNVFVSHFDFIYNARESQCMVEAVLNIHNKGFLPLICKTV